MVHPGFLWAKISVLTYNSGAVSYSLSMEAMENSAHLRRGGVQVQATTVEVDRHLEVLPVPEPTRVFLIVWIFEFSPSLTALVMRCSK